MWEVVETLWEKVRTLWDDARTLWDDVRTLWDEVRTLWDVVWTLWNVVLTLWDGIRNIVRDCTNFVRFDKTLWKMVRTLWNGVQTNVAHAPIHKHWQEVGIELLVRTIWYSNDDQTDPYLTVIRIPLDIPLCKYLRHEGSRGGLSTNSTNLLCVEEERGWRMVDPNCRYVALVNRGNIPRSSFIGYLLPDPCLLVAHHL